MSQYILILIWLAVVFFLSRSLNVQRKEYVLGKQVTRVSVGFAIFAMIPLIYWTITRPLSFGDCLLSS